MSRPSMRQCHHHRIPGTNDCKTDLWKAISHDLVNDDLPFFRNLQTTLSAAPRAFTIWFDHDETERTETLKHKHTTHTDTVRSPNAIP